jgi:hypothetical protein
MRNGVWQRYLRSNLRAADASASFDASPPLMLFHLHAVRATSPYGRHAVGITDVGESRGTGACRYFSHA